MTDQNNAAQAAEKEIDAIMEQAQVFASAWAFFGGPFDQGDGKEQAELEEARLREVVRDALSKLRAPVADELPHWEEVSAKLERDETLTPLEFFIYENEPAGGDGADAWRDQLASALASAPVAGEAQPVASLGVVLGLGEYIIQTTAAGEPAQVVFSQASDHDRATRTIGDLKVGSHRPFDHSRIRGQIQFTSSVALDALEVQLRELRKEHWPDTIDAAPQASEAKLVIKQCVLHGPAPEGFADWFQWLDAPVKMGAFIRAATADDWKRSEDASQAGEAQDLKTALGAALCRANSAEAMWRKCRDELKALSAALSAQPGAQKGER